MKYLGFVKRIYCFEHSVFKTLAVCVSAAMLFSACSWIGLNLNRPSLSKRVVEYGQPVPKGGGVYKIGKPYNIDGVRYTPKEDRYYNKVGQASWYGAKFHGRYTANREIYDMDALTAAHPTLPIPSYVRVTNLSNGRRLVVRVNDRGPYANDRIIDMSRRSAELLDFKQKGTAKVRVTYIGKAPLNGNDRYERQYLSQQYWFQGRNNRRYSSRSQNRRFARRSRPRRVAQRYDTLTVGSLPRESRYQSPISRNARYAIQTGSFYNYRNAKRRSTQVSRVGRAYIKSFDRDKGTLHKVMLGPFKNRKSAEYTLSQLYSSGMYDAILVKK